MKILNAKFLTGKASFLIPKKRQKIVFQYLVWFSPQNRANNEHMEKNIR